ncbi:MAG TPA: hypothetical protein VM287_06305 [Egibacteraceae bacterium]|nr:hypothetical protein [Egibacteraceae bacterium]
MRVRRTVVVAVGALGFTLAAFSVAWACTEMASISLSNYEPAAGDVIHVSGKDFYANAPVDIHLGAQNGPLIASAVTVAEASDKTFVEDEGGAPRGTLSVDVAIPADASPGRQILYAVSPGAAVAKAAIVIAGETPPEPAPPADPPAQPEPVTNHAPAPPADPPAQPEPAAVTPAPVPAPVEGVSTELEAVLTGMTQAVAPEPEPASSSAVLMDWRHTHGAMLSATAPAATPNMDWRHTHGALMHTGPAVPESPDAGAFADAIAAAERSGYEWAGVPQQEPLPVGAGLGLLAVGLMLLFGGFAAVAVTRRREKVPVPDK